MGGWAMLDELSRRGVKTLEDLVAAVTTENVDALAVARRAARTLGETLVWPVQVMDAKRIVVTGPLSPMFPKLKASLRKGLSALLTDGEIAALDPVASADAQGLMQRGAFLMARQLFLHPADTLPNGDTGRRNAKTA